MIADTRAAEGRSYLRWEFAGVQVAVSQRRGGWSDAPFDGFNLAEHVGDSPAAVARNRAALSRDLGLVPLATGGVQWLNQVHGDRIVRAARSTLDAAPDADAAWSNGDVAVAVMTADCLPVVLIDGDGRAFGVAHCGWRGIAAGLISKLARQMPSRPVAAYLGPAIDACCYQVDEQLLDHFPAAQRVGAVFDDPEPGKVRLSLVTLARAELAELGVSSVAGGEICCRCDERFFSYRRAAETGRFATVAYLSR